MLQIKSEDRGVERATAMSTDDKVRIASSDTIESLLESDFRLIINDTEYLVKSPPQVNQTRYELNSNLLVAINYQSSEFLICSEMI